MEEAGIHYFINLWVLKVYGQKEGRENWAAFPGPRMKYPAVLLIPWSLCYNVLLVGFLSLCILHSLLYHLFFWDLLPNKQGPESLF